MKGQLSAAIVLLAAAHMGLTPTSAFAHAQLVHAQPAVGSTVATPPSAVTIEFSEGVVPRLSGIAIRDAAGKAVKAGRAAGTGASLSAAIEGRLAPGTYTVTWHAISVDSHRTQGRFTFTVAP